MAPKINSLPSSGIPQIPKEIAALGLSNEAYEDAYKALEEVLDKNNSLLLSDNQESRRRLMYYDENNHLRMYEPDKFNTPEGRRKLVELAASNRLFAFQLGNSDWRQISLDVKPLPENAPAEAAEDLSAKVDAMLNHSLSGKQTCECNFQCIRCSTPVYDEFLGIFVYNPKKDDKPPEPGTKEFDEKRQTRDQLRPTDKDLLNAAPEPLQSELKRKPKISTGMRWAYRLTFHWAYRQKVQEADEIDRHAEQYLKNYNKALDKLYQAFIPRFQVRVNSLNYSGSEREDAKRTKNKRTNEKEKTAYNREKRAAQTERYKIDKNNGASQVSMVPYPKKGNRPTSSAKHNEREHHRIQKERYAVARMKETRERVERAVEHCVTTVTEKFRGSEEKAVRELILAAIDANPATTKGAVCMKSAIRLYRDHVQPNSQSLLPQSDDLERYISGLEKLDTLLDEGHNAKITLQMGEAKTTVLTDEEKMMLESSDKMFRNLYMRMQRYVPKPDVSQFAIPEPGASENAENPAPAAKKSKRNPEVLMKALTDPASPLAMLCGSATPGQMKNAILKVENPTPQEEAILQNLPEKKNVTFHKDASVTEFPRINWKKPEKNSTLEDLAENPSNQYTEKMVFEPYRTTSKKTHKSKKDKTKTKKSDDTTKNRENKVKESGGARTAGFH